MQQKTDKGTLKQRLSGKGPFYVMMAPFLLFFIVFMLIPVFASVILSLTNFNMLQMPTFVGIQNYVRLFTNDRVFTIALKNTLIFAVVIGPVGYVLSFVLAWLINESGRRVRSLLTLVMYAPSLAGNIFFIWAYIFSSDSRGLLNSSMLKLGLISQPILWLSDPKYNFTVCVIVAIWLSFGAGFLSFVAGLQAMDRSYYEAAAIDGLKNRWQELYYVTFPQMGPQLLFGAVMSISSAFAVGYQNMALTGFPSTNYSTHTILLHMIDYGTVRFEMGYASAIAVFLFALMLISWVIVNELLRRFND